MHESSPRDMISRINTRAKLPKHARWIELSLVKYDTFSLASSDLYREMAYNSQPEL